MSQNTTRKVRHIQKHGPAKDWSKATNFNPMAGEAIVYDADENYPIPRLKIGNGNTNVNELPFIGQSIIDVFNLPQHYIDSNVFYRVPTTKMVENLQEVESNVFIYYIKSLPANGEPVLNFDTGHLVWYYNVVDGIVYGYIDENLSAAAGAEFGLAIPNGWYPYSMLYEMTNIFPDLAIINVNELPPEGLPVQGRNGGTCLYYSLPDEIVYGYINAEIIANKGIDILAGWYPLETIMELNGDASYYGGIIHSLGEAEAIDSEKMYILISNNIYNYQNGNWNLIWPTAQPNWDQKNPAAPDYILNKPNANQPDWDKFNGSDAILNKPFGVVPDNVIIAEITDVNITHEQFQDSNMGPTRPISYGTFTPPQILHQNTLGFSDYYFGIDTHSVFGVLDIYFDENLVGKSGKLEINLAEGTLVYEDSHIPQFTAITIRNLKEYTYPISTSFLPMTNTISDSMQPITSAAVQTLSNDMNEMQNQIDTMSSVVQDQIKSSLELLKQTAPPQVNIADNKKILQVEDGHWVASNELPNKMASMETHILPEIKEKDNNKILKVIEGNQEWVEHKIMTAIETAAVASGENNIITLHDFDIDTPLTISSTGTKAFCAGKNWFSIDNMTYVKGNYTPGDNPNSFTITNNYVELSFNTPLPIGQYRVSTKAVLHDDTSLPMLRFFDSNNVSIAQTSATGTTTSYSPQFVYRTDYDRYGVTFYAIAPIAKMTMYAGHGNYPGANSSFTEFAISLADDTDWSYPGDYNGSIYDITQDAQITVSSNPMYIFSDDLQPCSIAYYISDALTELPSVTLDDNGKVLGIQQGRPAWITHSGDGNANLPAITEEDNYKFLRVIDGEAKWADNTIHILEPQKVSGSMVLINDEQAIDLPIQVESETATKVYIGGKNLFPIVDAFGKLLFNNNNELIIDASTKTTKWYREIYLPMQYPAGSYRLGFEGNNAYNENHASFGTPIGNTTAMCRFYLGSTLVATADVPINRGAQKDSHVNVYPSSAEYQPFDKIMIYSGAGNAGSLDIDAVLKNVCLYYDNESATTYTPATGKFYELPLPDLKLQDLPTRIFGNDGSELTATYYHGADMSTEEIAGMMLPEFTSDDNNKVLSIKNDKVAWTELPNDNSNIIPPDYYTTHLAEQTALINTYLKKASTNGDAFVFITDQHLEGSTPRNAGHSIELLKYINDNTKVRKLFFGGDICITEERLAQHVEKVSKIFEGDIAYAMGNHEYDTLANTGPRLTPEALCYIHDINKPKQIGNTERHYYYIDNPQQKIRYVVVNNWEHNPDTSAGHDGMVATDLEVQASWLTNTAFNVEAGWGIILFCHQFFNNPNASAPSGAALPFQTAIDTYNGEGEIIAVFHGHIHQDMVNRTGTGVPAIGVISDAYKDTYLPGNMQDNFIPREVGTITEQAFDVAIVDRYERKIYCVRIGCPALDGSGDANAQAVGVREIDFRVY